MLIDPIGPIRTYVAPHTYVENRIIRVALSALLSLAALYAQSWVSVLCLGSAAVLWISPTSRQDPLPEARSSVDYGTMGSLPPLVMLAAAPPNAAAATKVAGDFGPFPQRNPVSTEQVDDSLPQAPRRTNKTFAAAVRGDFQGGRGAAVGGRGQRKGRGQ